MAKKTGILFILAAVIGISVYFYKADPPPASARPASAPAAVPARRVSKAFQIMQAAGRPPGHSAAKAEAGVPGGVEDKDRDREKDRKEKLAFIARLRENGIAFVSGQEEYLATLTDVDASNEASYVLVLGNRLMASAVLTEMSRSAEYSGQLVNLLHDPAMRAFITGPMAEYFPVLSRHLERGEGIDAGNLSSLFPEDRDFLRSSMSGSPPSSIPGTPPCSTPESPIISRDMSCSGRRSMPGRWTGTAWGRFPGVGLSLGFQITRTAWDRMGNPPCGQGRGSSDCR